MFFPQLQPIYRTYPGQIDYDFPKKIHATSTLGMEAILEFELGPVLPCLP